MKYVSIKSIVMIIAISFSGSQAWANNLEYWEKYWNNVNKCPEKQWQAACMEPLKQVQQVPPDPFYVKFDIKWEGCLPSAAVSEDEVLNPGICLGAP